MIRTLSETANHKDFGTGIMEPLLPMVHDPGYDSHYNCKSKQQIFAQRFALPFVLT
jgi:hypothetical protein